MNSGTKEYQVKHSPYRFFNKNKFQLTTVLAKDNMQAVFNFLMAYPDKRNIIAVKSSHALRWRRDESLVNANHVLAYGKGMEWIQNRD